MHVLTPQSNAYAWNQIHPAGVFSKANVKVSNTLSVPSQT